MKISPTPPRPARPPRTRLVSPLLRRILLVNFVPLALLLAALLYLDQYQEGLLEAEVAALRVQARIYAGALAESAVRGPDPANPQLSPELARPLLRRLTDPSPDSWARIYAPGGALIADSRSGLPPQPASLPETQPNFLVRAYEAVLAWLPHAKAPRVAIAPTRAGTDLQPDVRDEIRLTNSDESHEMAPDIWRTRDGRLLVLVAEPVLRDRHAAGIVLLTRDAHEVDRSLAAVRRSIVGLFLLALVLTVLLSWYMSQTIARPILKLALAAHDMHEGRGRVAAIPPRLMRRRDEVGELAQALAASAAALWARMDAIERFAADVAHEIKNPLSSIRSAVDTLRRISEPAPREKLLRIMQDDVGRLDRLISDISDASRVDAELSRAVTAPVDVSRILASLTEISEATRRQDGPLVVADLPPGEPLVVQAVEGRLVQVLRNLIANAESFSPPNGRIAVRARETGAMVEIAVEDDGHGISDANLEHVFDRFYSERPAGESFGKHSGLGLSISRQIVEALQGRIAAENRRDEQGQVLGARFVVRLPKA